MMWDVVLPAWVALLEADEPLIELLGGAHIYPASAARKVRVPSVEYSIVDDRETELFNPMRVQVDYWARGLEAAAAIERRIRMVTHRDVARELEVDEYEGLRLWTRYMDSRTHPYPAEQGVVHRSMDFQIEPVRARFHTTTGG
jgi:hypothetical protein